MKRQKKSENVIERSQKGLKKKSVSPVLKFTVKGRKVLLRLLMMLETRR